MSTADKLKAILEKAVLDGTIDDNEYQIMNINFAKGETLSRFEDSILPNIVYNTDDRREEVLYLTLGLTGESGEVSEKIKKYWRGDYEIFEDTGMDSYMLVEVFAKQGDLIKEIGDILWYATRMAQLFGAPITAVLEANMRKLNDRKNRNKLQGNGDNR